MDTLLPWSIGAFTVATGYTFALPWLSKVGGNGGTDEGYAQGGGDSVSHYIDNPHANGAFAMSMVPMIVVDWVDLSRTKKASRLAAAALIASQLGLTAVVAFDDKYYGKGHDYGFTVMAISLMVYYFVRLRLTPHRGPRWPLHALLAASGTLLAAIAYTYEAPDSWFAAKINDGRFFYTEAALMATLLAFTPTRLYLAGRR